MKIKALVAILAVLLGFVAPADARFPRGGSSSSFTFNGSKLQTNLNFVGAGSYEFLDASKLAGPWGFANNAQAPVTPDILDADGYLISSAGNAASGVYRLSFVPTQDAKPGAYIYKWDGDGSVSSGSSSGAAVSYLISSATQAGTVVTVNLSSSPTAMRAGQPITVAGFTVNWSGLNNTWRVQDVNTSCSNCFRIDTGVSYTGGATSSSPAATFTTSTTVANVGGNLNGSGRYAFQPSVAVGTNVQTFSLFTQIVSIQSSVNYPRNIRVVNLNDEATLDAGGIFSSKLLTTAAKYGSIRFLNWQSGNNSNTTTWLTRKPVSYSSYNAHQLRSDIYVGATGQTGRTYTTSAPSLNVATGAAWSGLTDKATVTALISQGQATFVATFASGNTNITITGHTYAVGDRVNFNLVGGATLPSNITAGNYYTITAIAANTIQIGVTPNANSTGTINSILAYSVYTSTFTSANANIAIANHHYVVGDFVAFVNFGGTLPAAFSFSTYYYVCAATAGVSIQVAPTSTCAGTIITPGSSSTGTIVSSGQIYLNVGGTGAKPVKGIKGQIFTNNVWPDAASYMSLATFTYDATLDQWWMTGGNIDWGSLGILNSVPYEIQLELCRQVGAHPWWVMVPWASDPMTDLTPSLMQMVKTSGLMAQGMVPRFEPPNELWNTANAFIQTSYAVAKSAAYGWTFSYHDWYGKVLASLGQSGAQIFGIGNLGTTYHIIGGVQTAADVVGDLGNAFPRFAANSYVAGASPQAPLTGSWGTITFTAVPPAINGTTGGSTTYVSHLANAQYFTSNAYALGNGSGTQTIGSLSTAWNGTQFTATFAGTTMTVSSIDSGATLAIGRTISCRGVTAGTTITGGSAPAWTISNSTTIAYSQGCTAGADTTAPTKLVDSVVDTVVNATITGCPGSCVFTVNSITSGNTIGPGLQIYGGTIVFASGIRITGGTHPNYTISGSPGNQGPASFSIGQTFSLTGAGKLYQLWATWVNTNFGITKVEGYEGNYSNDYNGLWDLVTYASKQEPNLQTYATTNWNNFRATTGAIGSFPSVYNMTGSPVIGDAWSVLDDIYQTPLPPQMNAVNAY
jgi:hypothetical protein